MINANMKGSQKQSFFPPPKYFDLGTYRRPITTTSEEAQTWFDRGLIWVYGFNHEEAAKCFEKAIAADEGCAMAYWGLAYALGPNYNKPWDVFDERERTANLKRTNAAARQAETLSAPAEPVERALIHAIQSRYPRQRMTKDFSLWNKKYAEAMESVYRKFSDDLDVAALYADALMNLTPWALWDIHTGEPTPGSRVLEAKQVLDQGIATEDGFKHPGLLHSYIHLMEMSSTPEKALTIADRLRDLVPDAGHLRHMPSRESIYIPSRFHSSQNTNQRFLGLDLDIMCGDYRRAIAANSEAILADERFVAQEGPFNFYSLYRTHNYHFRIYAAMFSGQSKIALESVAQIEKSFPEELLRVESPPMADWLEGILSMRVHVFIRFGLWHDLLSLEFPKDQELYCVTTAMIYYGKGVALAATGKVEEAEEERTRFRDAVKRVPSSRTVFANKCIDVLDVAGAMLDGELAYRQGNFDLAFEELRRSISLDDALPYDEPWVANLFFVLYPELLTSLVGSVSSLSRFSPPQRNILLIRW